jgi:hypothetical protein
MTESKRSEIISVGELVSSVSLRSSLVLAGACWFWAEFLPGV